MGIPLATTRAKKRFYKQTFQIKKGSKTLVRHTLLVNPESMDIQEPAIVNVQQTLGGSYISNFGQGLIEVSLTGLTGYGARVNSDGIARDGYTEYKHFRDSVYRYFITNSDPNVSMFWYNWEDEDYYQIVPKSFRTSRSTAESLLYRYDLEFTCIRQLNKVSDTKPKFVSPISPDVIPYSAQLALNGSLSAIGEALGSFR